MRLVAIFPGHTVRLLGIVQQTKCLSRHHRYLYGLRKIAKTVVASRHRKVTCQLKRRLKVLHRTVRASADTGCAYWTAVSEGNGVACFDIVDRYANEQNRIESEYLRLVSESPNCPDAVYAFAKFLREIECDQHEAAYWEELGSYLEHSSEVCDLCHAQGMATFPGLPQQPSYQADERLLEMNNRFLSAGSLLDVTGELDEGRRQQQATIRDLAMWAPLTFIVVLRIATVLHLVLFVLFVCFMPIIPIRNVLELVRVSWANVRDADAVAAHLTEIEMLIAKSSIRSRFAFRTVFDLLSTKPSSATNPLVSGSQRFIIIPPRNGTESPPALAFPSRYPDHPDLYLPWPDQPSHQFRGFDPVRQVGSQNRQIDCPGATGNRMDPLIPEISE
jgi:hypothetical protein